VSLPLLVVIVVVVLSPAALPEKQGGSAGDRWPAANAADIAMQSRSLTFINQYAHADTFHQQY